MSSTTTTPLADARNAAVAAYTELLSQVEAAKAAGDDKLAISIGGKMSAPAAKVRQAELEMELAGETYEPWEQPRASKKARKASARPQAEIEADLAPVARVYHNEAVPESTRDAASVRIESLLRQATKAGYQVEDPRILEA